MARRASMLLIAATAFAATASPALAEWRGIYLVTAATPACTTNGIVGVGATGTMRFRVPNILGNNATTKLTFVQQFGAQSYVRNGALGASPLAVSGGGVGSGPYTWTNSTVAITSLVPAVLSATTVFASITAVVNNVEGIVGCNMTVRAGLNRRT